MDNKTLTHLTSNNLIRDAYFSNFLCAYMNDFVIPPYLQKQQPKLLYKLLKWDSEYFLAQWERNIGTYAAGTIRKYNEMFHVQFINGASLGKLYSLQQAGHKIQVNLSFRKLPKFPGYVIVDFSHELGE